VAEVRATLPILQLETRAAWRKWLGLHHAASRGVWLILMKKAARIPGVTYEEAVEEALCFGWIDSRSKTLDAERYKLRLSPRKPGSGWSQTNKQRIRKLVRAGRMTPAGMAKVGAAKKDGSWTRLDETDFLQMPRDLLVALTENGEARRNFQAFSASSKKIILFWIVSAKRPQTRQKRIAETARLAAKNVKAAHPGQ
jgi:uncharacterized protein YdeI (YjbR/CyaY-like superfamily)